jgi:hypothetical protein
MYDKLVLHIENRRKQLVITFFVLFFLLSMIGLKDYGLSWDEEYQWKGNGEISAAYIVHPSEETKQILLTSAEKYHGPAFELVLVFFEKALQLKDTRAVYLMRHVLTFLTFYIAVVFFYFLGLHYFKNWKLALIGCIFLVLSPRIFADSFYNSKDIIFLSFFIISMYALLKYHEQPSYKHAVACAFSCAFAIDIRVVGIILPAISILFLIIDSLYIFIYKSGKPVYFKSFLVYITCLMVFIIVFWPVLWEGPVYHFAKAIEEMRRFPWSEDVLYLGNYIKATELPWHYLPVWISISTPIPYLILFLIGLLFILRQCWVDPVNFIFHKKEVQLLLICSILVLCFIIVFKNVVYDGWRHVFFIYPSFVMLSLYGLRAVYYFCRNKKEVFFVALTLVMGYNLFLLIQLHPYQYVYFNRLAGKDMAAVKERFDLDYFGVSSKQALDYILKTDTTAIINIYGEEYPQRLNVQLLPIKQRKRIRLVPLEKADYFIGQYRFHKGEYDFKNKLFSVMVGNASIMSVFKLTEEERK